jgi:flagellar basal body-associated protein FliL
MMTLQVILFVLALTVTVVAFGATVWVSFKRPQAPKTAPDSSPRTPV